MLTWLGLPPEGKAGKSFGLPWSQGRLEPEELAAKDFYLNDVPVQSRIMAYWPDGSVKWTEHAAVIEADGTRLELTEKSKVESDESDLLTEKFNAFYIQSGRMRVKVSKHSNRRNLIDYVKINEQIVAKDFQLILGLNGRQTRSWVESLTVRQNGPVKAVLRLAGRYVPAESSLFGGSTGESGNRFVIYLTVYKELNQIEVSHTLEIGRVEKLQSVGLSYKVELKGELWNRFIGLPNQENVYFEAAQSLLSRRHMKNNTEYARQVEGKITQPEENTDFPQLLAHAKENAVWDSFSLYQAAHNAFELTKGTRSGLARIKIGDGQHSDGVLYVGGASGGTAVSVDKFWQKYPAELEVSGLSREEAEVRVWFWSPKAEPMDLRHYDDRDHMLSAYEGMKEVRSTPEGIANTSLLRLAFYDGAASREELSAFRRESLDNPRIVCRPEDYYTTGVFGPFSLPDMGRYKALEDKLKFFFDFYQRQVEQQGWYGYWNYGDFMHTYDPYRHTWLYDFGGYAWQNTELVPNMWLWLYFLRTGRREVFELAEAMTRHTSEVDIYHSGEYEGLGSRHNVIHWGCQAKEVRISMAGLHKYYYYLSCDERSREILESLAENEKAFERLEPLREFYHRPADRMPIRTGPDWTALVSNWFTNFELTGRDNFLRNIERGIEDIYAMEDKLLSGPTVLFDAKTKQLEYYGTGNVGEYHMVISFGAPEVLIEYAEAKGNDKLRQMIAEFGRYYTYTNEEMLERSNGRLHEKRFAWRMFATTMMAYAAKYYQDESLAQRAWHFLLDPELSGVPKDPAATLRAVNNWKTVEEMPWVTTNVVSQWCLNTIMCLELIGGSLPSERYF